MEAQKCNAGKEVTHVMSRNIIRELKVEGLGVISGVRYGLMVLRK